MTKVLNITSLRLALRVLEEELEGEVVERQSVEPEKRRSYDENRDSFFLSAYMQFAYKSVNDYLYRRINRILP